MQALIWLMSNEYNEYLKTGKGIYNLSEVDEKIDESIKRVTGNELAVSNKEVFSRAFLMWGTLSIFLADKKFTKKEQEIFQKELR